MIVELKEAIMENYYTTNAMYEYLEDNCVPGFLFARKNKWLLVYGTAASEPKLILVVSAVSQEKIDKAVLGKHEAEIVDAALQLSIKSELNAYVMRYCKDDDIIDTIQLINPSKRKYVNTFIDSLRNLFEDNGLQMSKASSAKSVNDRTSSPFHEWQRKNMGKDITVSDIDLIRLKKGKPQRIYELKRSFIPLSSWSPYNDDFPNYKLLANLADMADMDFQIVYNRRDKDPFFDDISKLKRFTFSAEEEQATCLDTISLEDFLNE